jgi:hypothetical protein
MARAHRSDDRGHTIYPEHDKVKIRYCAVPNANEHVGGWLPLVSVNGHQHGDTWSGRGLDRSVAVRRAARDAQGEADRYGGDWNVTVRRGRIAKRPAKRGFTKGICR